MLGTKIIISLETIDFIGVLDKVSIGMGIGAALFAATQEPVRLQAGKAFLVTTRILFAYQDQIDTGFKT